MQVAVKMHRTESWVTVDVPPSLLKEIRKWCPVNPQVSDNDQPVQIEDSAWYRRTRAETTPADALRIYRQNRGFSQSKLGGLLEPLVGHSVSRQNICDMESGRRGISKAMARAFARIFSTSAERFI